MADYTISIVGDINKAIKRDAKINDISVETLLACWLDNNLKESLSRYNIAQLNARLDAYEKAAPTAIIGNVRAAASLAEF